LIALRSGCLLNCEDGYFRFLHKSLVEYFAQEHIFKGVLGLLSLAANGETLNYALVEPNLLHMIAERVKEEPALKAGLYQLIQDSREQPELAHAAANALTIWHYAGEAVSTLPLQGVRVPGADLSGAILHLADCRNTDFSAVNFKNAYLAGANFEETLLANCQWDSSSEILFENCVTALVFSLDGKWLMVGDFAGIIYFVNIKSYQIDKIYNNDESLKLGNAVTCLAIDGALAQQRQAMWPSKYIASGNADGNIYLWKLTNNLYKGKFEYKERLGKITALAFHPNGKQLASAREDDTYTIYIWDVNTRQVLRYLRGHTMWVSCLAYSPRGTELASGSGDGTIFLWEDTTERGKVLCGHNGSVECVAFSPPGTQLASGSSDMTIQLWKTPTGEMEKRLEEHASKVKYLAYSLDGTELTSISYDKTGLLWDVITGNKLRVLKVHEANASCWAYSPLDGLLIRGCNKTVWLGGVEIEEWESLEHAGWFRCLSFSPEGTELASGSHDMTVLLWNVTIGKASTLEGHHSWVNCLAFSPRGTELASGSDDNRSLLWEVATGEIKKRFIGHTDSVNCVAFSPDGTELATGGSDETVRLWDVETEHEKKVLHGHTKLIKCLAYSPKGTKLASGSNDKTIHLWKVVKKERKLHVLKGHFSGISCLAFSQDGTELASGSSDKTVILWEVKTGNLRLKLAGHTERVICLAYSSLGSELASGDYDNTIRLWCPEEGICKQAITLPLTLLTLKWCGTNLHIGMEGANHTVVSFIYGKTFKGYRLLRFNPEKIPAYCFQPFQQLNIEKARGLTSFR
ncbi:MAG: pentapeptide repeat-containing protein, partial [Gammaproteobacteria bacterium]